MRNMTNEELEKLMQDLEAEKEKEKQNAGADAAEAAAPETEAPSAQEAAPETAEQAAPETEEAAGDMKRKKELKAALEKKDAELAAQKDQYLRLMAEYQNYRNRTTEEKKKIYGDAKVDCIKELLTVADSFDRAVSTTCSDETYKKGVDLTYSQFEKALEKLGISAISPLGETFDPNLHSAIRQVEEGDFEENTVCEVYQKGYVLGDRLIRPAVVAVKN